MARCKRVPFVFEVRDLWPESLAAVGMGRAIRCCTGLWPRSPASCTAIRTGWWWSRPHFEDYLVEHWHVPREKISVIENGVETKLFAPLAEEAATALRRELGAEGRFVVSYIGTMGMAHGLETILAAAAQLQSENPEVVFLMIGEGADKERITGLARGRGLNNLRFIDQQPREQIPSYICASDICLVLLKKTDLFKTVIPTKMLEFMSCARPIILGVEGQARAILEEARAGIVIEPENSEALVKAIRHLAANRELAHDARTKRQGTHLGKVSRAARPQENTSSRSKRVLKLPARGSTRVAA